MHGDLARQNVETDQLTVEKDTPSLRRSQAARDGCVPPMRNIERLEGGIRLRRARSTRAASTLERGHLRLYSQLQKEKGESRGGVRSWETEGRVDEWHGKKDGGYMLW